MDQHFLTSPCLSFLLPSFLSLPLCIQYCAIVVYNGKKWIWIQFERFMWGENCLNHFSFLIICSWSNYYSFFGPCTIHRKNRTTQGAPINLDGKKIVPGFSGAPLKLGPNKLQVPPNNSSVRSPQHLCACTLHRTHFQPYLLLMIETEVKWNENELDHLEIFSIILDMFKKISLF